MDPLSSHRDDPTTVQYAILTQILSPSFFDFNLLLTRLKTDQSIYVRFNEDRPEYNILTEYIDDLIIVGTTQEAIRTFKQKNNSQ